MSEPATTQTSTPKRARLEPPVDTAVVNAVLQWAMDECEYIEQVRFRDQLDPSGEVYAVWEADDMTPNEWMEALDTQEEQFDQQVEVVALARQRAFESRDAVFRAFPGNDQRSEELLGAITTIGDMPWQQIDEVLIAAAAQNRNDITVLGDLQGITARRVVFADSIAAAWLTLPPQIRGAFVIGNGGYDETEGVTRMNQLATAVTNTYVTPSMKHASPQGAPDATLPQPAASRIERILKTAASRLAQIPQVSRASGKPPRHQNATHSTRQRSI